MKILIVSGSKGLLDRALEEVVNKRYDISCAGAGAEVKASMYDEASGNVVYLTDSYKELLDFYQDKERLTLITVLYDPDYPLNFDGVPEDYFKNMGIFEKNIRAGEYMCDCYIDMSWHPEKAMDTLGAFIDRYIRYEEVMKKIKEGTYTLMFESWFFSGGHGEDSHNYIIKEKGEKIGKIILGYDDVTVEIDGYENGFYNYTCSGRQNEAAYTAMDKLIKEAMLRDDPQFVNPPADNMNISREDILNGTYPYYEEEQDEGTVETPSYFAAPSSQELPF